MAAAVEAAWEELLGGGGASAPPPAQLLPEPEWPAGAEEGGSALFRAARLGCPPRDLGGVLAALRALRFALALGQAAAPACGTLEGWLVEGLGRLEQDAELATDVAVFSRSYPDLGAQGGSALRPSLQRRGALDGLAVALWAWGRRTGADTPHPVGLAVQIEAALRAGPSGGAAVEAALDASGTAAATAMGRGSDGSLWAKGGNSLLQYARARWAEAVCAVAACGATANAPTRAALLSFLGVGRDCSARHMAFAVPSHRALRLLRASAKGGVVEIGAHNGYWAWLLANKVGEDNVQALDIVPPAFPWWPAVCPGTADSLPRTEMATLLICMPSPGESDLADASLRKFKGSTVAYVGEWGSGMTGTESFHRHLLSDAWVLEAAEELPSWPRTRIGLFIFRRAKVSVEGAAGARAKKRRKKVKKLSLKMPLACDVCGTRSATRRCPWSRRLGVCGQDCYDRSEPQHNAALALTFCGARIQERPPLEEWEPAGWLSKARASAQQWDALRSATPQGDQLE